MTATDQKLPLIVNRFRLEPGSRQPRPRTVERRVWRQVIAFGSFCFTLAGCEVESMYGIELVDSDEAESRMVIEKSDFTLYALVGNHPEAPGITLIAISSDWPAEPQWDWEEFQSWPPDRQSTTFGSFYDQKYRELSVSHSLECPLPVESFDHRESAQEVAYGRWLHDLSSDEIGLHPKGIMVDVPIGSCDRRANSPAGAIEEFTVTVHGGPAEEDKQVEIRFRTYLVEKYIQWLF